MRRVLYLMMMLSVFVGCDKLADRPWPWERPDDPKVEGSRIDVKPVPVTDAPAFVGGPGDEAAGYPLRKPDMVMILSMLRLKRFEVLEAWLTHYQAELERDYRNEYFPDLAVGAFFVADPEIGALLDEWVARSPDHFAPWVARGNHRFKMGMHFRGTKYADKTSVAQFASMDTAFEAATKDFVRALELEPQLIAAHRRLVQVANDKELERKWLDESTKVCPLCYTVRSVYLIELTPRWGGSYEAMDAYVEEVRPLMVQNPRLKALGGYAHWDRCRLAHAQDQHDAALFACDAALAAGEDIHFLEAKARLYDGEKEPQRVLPFLDRILTLQPQQRDALARRAYVRIKAADYLGAARDMVDARHLDPTDAEIAKDAQWLVDMLRYQGDQLVKKGEHDEAAKYFALGLQLAPDTNDLRHRSGFARKAGGLEQLEIQIANAPEDFELRLQRDHALAAQRKFDEVVVMWDEFITRHPKDPRPFAERAGAKWHLRRHAEAIADMDAACSLGHRKSCDDATKMRSRIGAR